MLHARSVTRPGHFSLLVEVLLLMTDKHLRILIVVDPHTTPCDASVIFVCCLAFRPQPVCDMKTSLLGDKGASCRTVITKDITFVTTKCSPNTHHFILLVVWWGKSPEDPP